MCFSWQHSISTDSSTKAITKVCPSIFWKHPRLWTKIPKNVVQKWSLRTGIRKAWNHFRKISSTLWNILVLRVLGRMEMFRIHEKENQGLHARCSTQLLNLPENLETEKHQVSTKTRWKWNWSEFSDLSKFIIGLSWELQTKAILRESGRKMDLEFGFVQHSLGIAFEWFSLIYLSTNNQRAVIQWFIFHKQSSKPQLIL